MSSIKQKDIVIGPKSHSQNLSERVRKGIQAKRERIIELEVKRGDLEDCLKNINKEIKELEKTKKNIFRLLING